MDNSTKKVLYLDMNKWRVPEVKNMISQMGLSVDYVADEVAAIEGFNNDLRVNGGYDAVVVGHYASDASNVGAVGVSEVFSDLDLNVPLFLIHGKDENPDTGYAFFYGVVQTPFIEGELERSMRRFLDK